MSQYEHLLLKNQLCFPLYACAKELVRLYRQPLETLDLTYTQYIVMLCLWEYKELSVSELGEKLHLDSGTLTPLLKRLAKKELIQRRRDNQDERKLYVSITGTGLSLQEKANQVAEKMEGCIDLEYEDIQQLKQLLEKALRKMEESK